MFFRHVIASPVGPLTLVSDGMVLWGVFFQSPRHVPPFYRETTETAPVPVLTEAQAWLDAYFAGHRPSPEALALHLEGTEFQKEVWRLLWTIPYGEVTTYGALARQIESERGGAVSARAVGGAVGRNPLSIVLPCHRVVAADGLGGFEGGRQRKLWLLRHEGVDLDGLDLVE